MNQIYDLSRKNKIKDTQNELLELVDICNVQHGLPNAFLREVRTAPELSTFLANDRQLQDIEKFCKNKLNGVVLGIDPTYNTVIIMSPYVLTKNPLLEVSGTDRSPVMIGPAITHAQKTFESYFTLPHNMLRHNRNIAQLKAFATDAEVNVFQAFKTCFPNADHLLCWKSGNVKVKGLLDSEL